LQALRRPNALSFSGPTLPRKVVARRPQGGGGLFGCGRRDTARVHEKQDTTGQIYEERRRVRCNDEMGTVLALVNDSDSTNPAKPVTPVRYLYTPYGEAHAEVAPEVLGVKFATKINDVPVTAITDLLGTVRTQTVADATTAAGGMFRVVLSLPAESATLGAALSVETSTTKDVWSPVAESQYAIGQKPDRPEEIDVLPLSGWNRGASYRVTLAASLTDKVGRAMGSEKSFDWPIPGSGDVTFETTYPVNYETYLAAGESAGGAFVGGQPMGFQGAYSDNLTGLQYKRARFYDPRTLEFLSEDSQQDKDSPNAFAFVQWAPHSGMDPDGNLTIWIWYYRGTVGPNRAFGHASITLEDGTHISWWPQGNEQTGRRGSLRRFDIYEADAYLDQTKQDDVDLEEKEADEAIHIDGLNEAAIRQWWATFKTTNTHWRTLSSNCSTVVAEALKAGGADAGLWNFWTAHNLIWKPDDVKAYGEAVKKYQDAHPVKASPLHVDPNSTIRSHPPTQPVEPRACGSCSAQ